VRLLSPKSLSKPPAETHECWGLVQQTQRFSVSASLTQSELVLVLVLVLVLACWPISRSDLLQDVHAFWVPES